MEHWQLQQRQSLPLEAKVVHSKQVIRQWWDMNEGLVYVAFSGGKDSTVLLDLVRSIYPDIPAVFIDTGLEYPEIREFVKTFENVIWIKPEKSFNQILEDHGYPVVSKKVSSLIDTIQNPSGFNKASVEMAKTGIKKNGEKASFRIPNKWRYLIDADFKISNKCCDFMKKEPAKRYAKESGREPYIGTLASDSGVRTSAYLSAGCNSEKNKRSAPLSIWMESDIWEYIKTQNLSYCKIYDMGPQRTGCIFCMFGMEYDPFRFATLAETHPKLHKYCMDVLGLRKVLEFLKYPTEPIPKIDTSFMPNIFGKKKTKLNRRKKED